MKIKTYENYNVEVILDTHYDIVEINRFGEEIPFEIDYDEDDYNPYSLEEAVEILIKYEKPGRELVIKKITENFVSKEEIDKIKIQLDSNKYNV